MGQEADEKWAAAVGLQPTIPKSDRLLGTDPQPGYYARSCCCPARGICRKFDVVVEFLGNVAHRMATPENLQ